MKIDRLAQLCFHIAGAILFIILILDRIGGIHVG